MESSYRAGALYSSVETEQERIDQQEQNRDCWRCSKTSIQVSQIEYKQTEARFWLTFILYWRSLELRVRKMNWPSSLWGGVPSNLDERLLTASSSRNKWTRPPPTLEGATIFLEATCQASHLRQCVLHIALETAFDRRLE